MMPPERSMPLHANVGQGRTMAVSPDNILYHTI